MTDLYNIKNITFKWNKISNYIFKNVTFSIKKNLITAIIGKNGSGKTTLLKLLANFLYPTSGQIYLNNNDIINIKKKDFAQQIAYVAQNTNERIPLPVKEIVKLGNLPNQNIFNTNDKIFNNKTLDSLKTTGILHLKNRYFSTLSGGEKQKVMITRALCQNTKAILLDEPTSSLDIKNKIEIMKLLKSLGERKKISIIFVSHNLNLISEFANNVILLHNKNIECGEKKSILQPSKLQKAFETKINMTKEKNKTIFFY